MIVLIYFFVVVLLISGWFMICNNRTLYHRMRLLKRISDANPESWNVFDSVSYDTHLWRLFTLRNPWSIYPVGIKHLRGEA